jgi:hypothetical protein
VDLSKSSTLEPTELDLVGKGRVGRSYLGFLATQEPVFVTHVSNDPGHLDIQPLDFFSCTLHPEESIHGQSSCRFSPWSEANILAGVTKEVEVSEKGVFDNAVP